MQHPSLPSRTSFIVCCLLATALNAATLVTLWGGLAAKPPLHRLKLKRESVAAMTVVAAVVPPKPKPPETPEMPETPKAADQALPSVSTAPKLAIRPKRVSPQSPEPVTHAPVEPLAASPEPLTQAPSDPESPIPYYNFPDVDTPAEPESDWNLDAATLDGLGLKTLVFDVYISHTGEVVGLTILQPEGLDDAARTRLQQRMSLTTVQPAVREGRAVNSVRRIRLSTEP
jgi:hypothetical protein